MRGGAGQFELTAAHLSSGGKCVKGNHEKSLQTDVLEHRNKSFHSREEQRNGKREKYTD